VSWDNAVAESFCATIKSDLLHRRTLPTRAPVSRRASRRDPARRAGHGRHPDAGASPRRGSSARSPRRRTSA